MATHDRPLAQAVSHVIYEIQEKKLVRISGQQPGKGENDGAEN